MDVSGKLLTTSSLMLLLAIIFLHVPFSCVSISLFQETEEALKKELGISASTISPASGQLPFSVNAGIHR